MKKITDFKNEEAIELLADILEPASEIFADAELKKAFEANQNKMQIVKLALKNHKEAIVQILASMNGVPVEEYSCNIITIFTDVLEILNDKELMGFFTLQEQMGEQSASQSVSENTKALKK